MADKDLNIVKPVDGLQNIAGLTPARRREERKRRQNLNEKKHKESEQQLKESVDQQDLSNEPTKNKNGDNPDDVGIDYCA
jgi:hypothetical protein